MWRMRQRLLPVAHSSSPQDPPHGRIPAQVPSLQQVLQPALQLEDPPLDPYRPQTLRVQLLRQSLQKKLRLASSCSDSRSW
nr:unnamed protein product [Callosobruchus chinensis]